MTCMPALSPRLMPLTTCGMCVWGEEGCLLRAKKSILLQLLRQRHHDQANSHKDAVHKKRCRLCEAQHTRTPPTKSKFWPDSRSLWRASITCVRRLERKCGVYRAELFPASRHARTQSHTYIYILHTHGVHVCMCASVQPSAVAACKPAASKHVWALTHTKSAGVPSTVYASTAPKLNCTHTGIYAHAQVFSHTYKHTPSLLVCRPQRMPPLHPGCRVAHSSCNGPV